MTEKFEAVRDAASAALERRHIPGVVVGVTHEGEEDVAGLGVTSVEHPLPVDDLTLFQIGSITKTFTGTLVMRLVEAGEVDLDEPIRTYLPDLRLAEDDVARRVTMRHLLTHTGGWEGDYFDDYGLGDDALARMVAAVADLPQVTRLGEVWSYNNAGFYVAGRVVEVVTGRSFEAAMRELVLEPLGLAMTFFCADDVVTHRVAVGHHIEGEKVTVARPWRLSRSVSPAGGLVSTARDLLRYARFHMGDGETADGTRLLSAESMALMRKPHTTASGRDEMGLTWFLRPIDGGTTLAHGGGTNGQVSRLQIKREQAFALVVFANGSRGGSEVLREASTAALRSFLGLEEPEPEPLRLAADELTEYAGRYGGAMIDVELRIENGTLVEHLTSRGGFPEKDSPPLPAPPPFPLEFYERDRAVVTEGLFKGSFSEFLRDDHGHVAYYRDGGRVLRRAK